jgi:hypothetical protein
MARTNTSDEEFILNLHNNRFSSIPAYAQLSKKSQKLFYIKKELVKEWFEKNKERIMKAKDLSLIIGIKSEASSVYLRDIISYLVEIESLPIVSCHEGFFYTEKIEHLMENHAQNSKRIDGILRRNTAIMQIINKMERKNEMPYM